ncbi:MAG: TIGR00730 family Rossman fold protein [Verrucomicrobiaceae bacterium]|nr:TIGR00730 family Rossman fold protein [Verrucomicrobiaceae bacterium]
MFHSLAIYCGSAPGNDPAFISAAHAAGATLARRSIRVVYGGGGVGMMGALADGALRAGGKVIGVIPEFLNTRELQHPDVEDMIVVKTMHERKLRMVEEAQGFIALPGGFGTLDELFEVLTWAQLGIHGHPVGLLNIDGFFDGILQCLDHMVTQGFLMATDRQRLIAAADTDTLLDAMAAWKPPSEIKFTLAKRVVV